jgi:hypothetical protein
MMNPLGLNSDFGALFENDNCGSSVVSVARLKTVVLCAIWLFAPAPTSADPITFQNHPVGAFAGDAVALSTDGVTVVFAGLGLHIRDIEGFGFPSGASRVLSTAGDVEPITATFAGGFTTDFIQIRNWLSGTYTSEVDTIRMSAFDASHTLLGTIVSSNHFISLTFPGMAMVSFDDFRHGEGYVIDDFTIQPVPEPATLLLVGVGAVGLVANRRRRNEPRS